YLPYNRPDRLIARFCCVRLKAAARDGGVARAQSLARVPFDTPRDDRRGTACDRLILIVTPRPIWMVGIAPTLRRQIKVVIATQQRVQAPRVGGIGMKDLVLCIPAKHADAGQFLALIACVNRDRAKVVLDAALADPCLWKANAEVEIKIAAVGRHPLKAPAHAPLVGNDLCEGGARDRNDPHVTALQMLSRTIDVLGLK